MLINYILGSYKNNFITLSALSFLFVQLESVTVLKCIFFLLSFQTNCSIKGTNLVEVESSEENTYIRTMAVNMTS